MRKKRTKTQIQDNPQICFLISPIGKQGTDTYSEFKEVLDYLIRPAIKESGYNLKVIRADEIERAGSFIKDIFETILDSFVVIADLTNQNPNVFYELGVRHSLSPGTILIAQTVDDIPSDLREYRTIIYDTSAKGATLFKDQLTSYIKEIYEEHQRSDNPVLDRLGVDVDSGFNEVLFSANDVDWDSMFSSVNSIDILFVYGRTWRGRFSNNIIRFLSQQNSTLRIILPNLENKKLIECLASRFHKDLNYVTREIRESVSAFKNYHKRAGLEHGRLEIWFADEPMMFSMYRFGNKVVLALYAHRYRSPVPHFLAEEPEALYTFARREFALLSSEKESLSKRIYPTEE